MLELHYYWFLLAHMGRTVTNSHACLHVTAHRGKDSAENEIMHHHKERQSDASVVREASIALLPTKGE